MQRREALITGVVLGLMCAAIAGLFVIGRTADREELFDLAGDDPVVIDDAPDSEFDAFVAEAVAFVEATRGGRFLTRPAVITLDESAFVGRIQAEFAESFADNPEDVEMFNAFYRAAGLIGPDENIVEVYDRFGEAGVLGFYDPVTDELVVRQREGLSLLTKSTIVHELTHAFDDQHFDLDRPEYDDRTDEVSWGFSAVAEGSASWVEARWEDTLSSADQGDLLQEEFSFADPGILDGFELAFLLLELSPYEYGEAFVEHLIGSGGTLALDEALVDPPVTSEQVMSPDRYDADEGAIELPAPPADGEVHFTGLGGQVLIDSMFAATGVVRGFEWGGDQMVVWTNGEQSCLRWDIRSESGRTDSVSSAFEQWGSQVGGVDVSSVDERTVRVERCA